MLPLPTLCPIPLLWKKKTLIPYPFHTINSLSRLPTLFLLSHSSLSHSLSLTLNLRSIIASLISLKPFTIGHQHLQSPLFLHVSSPNHLVLYLYFFLFSFLSGFISSFFNFCVCDFERENHKSADPWIFIIFQQFLYVGIPFFDFFDFLYLSILLLI